VYVRGTTKPGNEVAVHLQRIQLEEKRTKEYAVYQRPDYDGEVDANDEQSSKASKMD